MKWVALALLVAGWLLTGLAQVQPGERAVVRRFGAVAARPGPGLHAGLPWPFERVDRVPVRFLRRVTAGYVGEGDGAPGQLLTGDQNLINVQAVLNYALRDDDNALDEFVQHRDRIDTLLTRAAESALAEWCAARPVDAVLLTGKDALRGWLVRRVQEQLDDYRLGVAVQSAEVTLLAPPDEVKSDFDAVTRAQAAIPTRVSEAKQEADRKLRDAQADALRLARLAEAYAFEKRALAHAEATAFVKRLEQYRRLKEANPDVLASIWWDEMGPVFARLREAGRVDLLDSRLGPDGLDVTQFPPRGRKR